MQPPFFQRLHVRLILAIGLPLLLLNGGQVVFEYRFDKRDAIAAMQAYLRETTRERAAGVDAEFAAIAQVARSSATFLSGYGDDNEAQLARLLRNNLEQHPLIYGSAVAFVPEVRRSAQYAYRGPQGVTYMDIARDAYDYTQSDWFEHPLAAGKPTWSRPYYDEGAGNVMMVTYSVPWSQNGKVQGVVTLDIALDDLPLHEVGNWGGQASIVGARGTFLSRSGLQGPPNDTVFEVAQRLGLPELSEVAKRMLAGESGVVRLPEPQVGEGVNWLAYAPIPTTGWGLMARVSEARVLENANQQLRRHLLMSLGGTALILLLLMLVARYMTRPLVRLSAIAQAVGQGNVSLRAGSVRSRDEIGQFARVFDQMLDDLRVAVAGRLREATSRQAIESEVALARDIQRELLPHVFPPFPALAGQFDLYALCNPATTMSGDFYDYFLLDEHTVVLVIADVCGKGMPAALYMALARTTLRNFSVPGRAPAQVLADVNRALASDNAGCMFVTVFCAHYSIASGRLRYASAGHPAPWLMRHDGSHEALSVSGDLLGVFPDAQFDEGETTLAPGDVLLLYTDGVTESAARGGDEAAVSPSPSHDAPGSSQGLAVPGVNASGDTVPVAADAPGMDAEREPFGDERLLALLQETAHAPVDVLCQGLAAAVLTHCRGEPDDDLTLLALRRALPGGQSGS